MTKVNCSVNSCEFWGQGNICTAEAISVKKEAGGDLGEGLYGMEYADELGIIDAGYEEDNYMAETSSQTCCETMRPVN